MSASGTRPVLSALAALALVLLAGAPPAFATNGARPIASGGRAAGRAGSDTAVADDASAINTNPAGLAFIDGQRFDGFNALFVPALRWKNRVDSVKSKAGSLGGVIGGSFGVCFDWEEPWKLGEAMFFEEETDPTLPPRSSPEYAGSGVKIGFGVFPLSGSLVDFEARSPFFPDRRMHWDADIKEVAVAVAVAWRPTHWLSFGLTPQFVVAQLENDQPVTQPKAILRGHPFGDSTSQGVTYADAAPFLGVSDIEGFADIDDARTFGFRARMGVYAIPVEWEWGRLSVGLTYTTQAWKQDFLGTATVDFSQQINALDPDGTLLKPIIAANTGIPEDQQTYSGRYNVRLNPLNLPQEIALGAAVAHSFGDMGILFSADVTWLNWSATWKTLDGRLYDGESRELNELTSDEGNSMTLDVPLDWRDQVVIAVGAAFMPTDWLVLRAGYNYGRNPVPADTLQPTTPAIIEHHATCGVGVHIRRLEVSLSFEHGFEKTAKITTSRANRDVENSEISASISAVALGFSLRF